jgi:hypothetical protein
MRADRTSSERPDEVPKDKAIAEAGVSRSTAYDYQSLIGGREVHARSKASAAPKNHFANAKLFAGGGTAPSRLRDM